MCNSVIVRIKDSCWSVWMIYDPRGLSVVSTVGPGVDGVLQYLFILHDVV
jgi:hypothetical protein